MLTLHRGPNTVVTDESFSVKLKWVNPCCFYDSIPGNVGLGIDISVNEYTRAEFGNPERFEKFATGNDRKFPDVSIRFSGVILIRGTLIITNASSQSYSAWLQSEVGVLGTKQRDKFITEMPWKTGVAFNPVPGGSEYGWITIYNPKFWDGKGREVKDDRTHIDENGDVKENGGNITYLTKQFLVNHGGFINRIESGNIVTTGEGCVVSPYLNLNYVIGEILRMNNFFIAQNSTILTNPLAQILIYNNYNIFTQEFTTEETEFKDWDATLGEYVNVVTREILTMTWSIGTFNYADLLPRISLKDFLLDIQNWLNLVFHFRNDQSVVLVDRDSVFESEPYDLDQYFMGDWIVGERKDVSLKFTQQVDTKDELFSEEWHDLSERRANYKAAVDTKAELLAIASPALGDLRLVREESKIYEYKWAVGVSTSDQYVETQTDVLEWAFASNIPQPYFYGTSEIIEEIKTGISTLTGSILPRTAQKGNVSSSRSLWSDFSFRCLAYGIIALNDALVFDAPEGIFNTRWKNTARFLTSSLPVEGDFMLPLNEIYYIINNITKPFSTRHGKFIIEEIECDFQGAQIGLAHVKGYKI